MSYSTKNYTTDGGDRTVIGGVLEIAGGKVIKDGQEVSLDGGSQAEPGTGSVMEEHLNSAITERISSLEDRLKALETVKTEPAATE